MPTRKNNYNPPICKDLRTLYVPVGCGNCIECRKKKASEWRIRLQEELKVQKYAYFVTFTFAPEQLEELCKKYKLKESNAVATKAVRMYLERWRKIHKKSQRHWLITELGHEGTERIHLHGVVFNDEPISIKTFEEFWQYGNIWIGDYCTARTINYIIKYVTKVDSDHKGFKAEILCSKGIGSNYLQSIRTKQRHKYQSERTIEYYRQENGAKVSLPIYYRNKLFTEEEREQLWLQTIERGERYVMGAKIENFDTEEGQARYWRVLRRMREINRKLGYGDDSKEWQAEDYNITQRMINRLERIIEHKK